MINVETIHMYLFVVQADRLGQGERGESGTAEIAGQKRPETDQDSS